MTQEINFYSRKEEYGWLSNFERCTQEVDDLVYPTNEHYYQSQKAKEQNVFFWIVSAPSPYLAMIAGRGLRPLTCICIEPLEQEIVDRLFGELKLL